ncbi:MAG: DNA polymerase III subunit gamma/tau [Oscillospiraceae bacterium]
MYLSLYRKYRPTTFEDVISQPHITTTLKNQISAGKHGHAYLFTGSRGTGKTTCAKILAMAVNCHSPKNGSPCLECEACREIADGSAVDIVEMDAASNNGVNDVRMLRDEVAYTPVSCKYRVYIIDEVHMMSAAAFNALLKTLEEPPSHVIFILATTELHKVPATIVSRCQRFEFRRIDVADSADRLLAVAANEGIDLERSAAELISRLSDGGMRDALSILDRCVTDGSAVTCDVVRSCAGVADNVHLFSFARMIAQKDISGCLKLLQQLYSASKDLARLVDELSSHYRDLMLIKTVPEDKELISAMPDEYPQLEQICSMYTLDDILRCLDLLQKCADSIGKTRHRKTAAEMTLIRMCTERTAAAAPTPPSVPQEQRFAPVSDDKLSPQVAAIVNKTKALSEELTKKAEQREAAAMPSAAPKPAEEQPVHYAPPDDAPAPELDSTPAAVTEYDVPLPDAPPEEPIQREFDAVPPVQDEPIPAAEPVAAIENTQASPTPAEPLLTSPDKLPRITPEFWNSCVELIPGMMGFMLADSSASVNPDGILEIHTDNLLLLNQVKEHGYQQLEKELSAVIGKNVRANVIGITKEETVVQENTAVKQLLDKGRQLNIEIEIKK